MTLQPSVTTSRSLLLSRRAQQKHGVLCETVTDPQTDISKVFAYPDNAFDEVTLEQVAERLVTTSERAKEFWKELHRVCAHGSLVTLRVAPTGEKNNSFPSTLQHMQDTVVQTWSLNMDDVACFATQNNISFGVVSYTPVFSYDFHRMIKRRKSTQEEALALAEKKSNVLLESVFVLVANKQLRGFEEVSL